MVTYFMVLVQLKWTQEIIYFMMERRNWNIGENGLLKLSGKSLVLRLLEYYFLSDFRIDEFSWKLWLNDNVGL